MICPRCGNENIEGMDRCDNCMEPLRDRDVPQSAKGFQRLIMEEPVSTLIHSSPAIVAADTTVAEAIRQMKKDRLGCVIVAEDGLLTGIFTERDVLLKLAGERRNLEELTVGDVMTPSPDRVEAEDSLRFALNKMSVGGFRHIPVTDEGRVTGIVTAKDALNFIAREAIYKEGRQ